MKKYVQSLSLTPCPYNLQKGVSTFSVIYLIFILTGNSVDYNDRYSGFQYIKEVTPFINFSISILLGKNFSDEFISQMRKVNCVIFITVSQEIRMQFRTGNLIQDSLYLFSHTDSFTMHWQIAKMQYTKPVNEVWIHGKNLWVKNRAQRPYSQHLQMNEFQPSELFAGGIRKSSI